MSTEWFCKIMGEQWGPMSSQELMAVASRGRLTRDDVVRKGANGTWVRAELVKGLFNTAPPAVTATSNRAAVPGRTPSPAKRSVRVIRIRQYWVKVGNDTAGPFSGPRLRKLAAKGKLKPHYLVGEDRIHWVRACDVEGLFFDEAAPQAPTASVRSTIWPLEPLPEQPKVPQAEDIDPEVGCLVLAEAAAVNS